jgi:hypothetical protein
MYKNIGNIFLVEFMISKILVNYYDTFYLVCNFNLKKKNQKV